MGGCIKVHNCLDVMCSLGGLFNGGLTWQAQANGKKTYSLEVTHVGNVLHGGSIEDQIGDACRLGVLLVVFDEDLK